MKLSYVLAVTLAAAALAGCETTGSTPSATATAAPEPPLTHAKAAEQCWMATEKGRADMNLDKRVDVVDKCIAEKMKAAQTAQTAQAAPKH
ncbi:MAG TPA: hypothetical protein VHD14_11860 [Pseudolabrys sp.]|jgi:hypothetical protein|nr:hypothetical protein [Pseudolabrys sp.]